MKLKIVLACALVCAASLAGCTSEHSSTTTANFTVETDEGTTSYNYSSEDNNGEVTTESNVTTTPAAEETTEETTEEASSEAAGDDSLGDAGTASDEDGSANSGTAVTTEHVEVGDTNADEDPEVTTDMALEADWLDGLFETKWDSETAHHDVQYDDAYIYVHAWSDDTPTLDDVDADAYRNNVIPSWIDAIPSWAEAWEENGWDTKTNVCFQYLTGDTEYVIFTIENGELAFFCYD